MAYVRTKQAGLKKAASLYLQGGDDGKDDDDLLEPAGGCRAWQVDAGGKQHDYPEEIFIVEGRLFDAAFHIWLEPGHYASRPPHETHGPFRTDTGCLVLEVSFPNRKRSA